MRNLPLGKKSERREQRIAAAKARDAVLQQGGGFAVPSSHFQRVVNALTMAAPIWLVLSFEDGLSYCIEASICAAEVLMRRQIQARAVPCAAVAVHRTNAALRLSSGLTAKQIYDEVNWGDGPVLPFEEWKLQHANRLPTQELTIHAVVNASTDKESALIDLTIGQLRAAPMAEAKTIPWQIVLTDGPFESRDWTIGYKDAPASPEVMAKMDAMLKAYSNSGYVADLDDLVGLALHCDLDLDRFRVELGRQHPEALRTAIARIAHLGGV